MFRGGRPRLVALIVTLWLAGALGLVVFLAWDTARLALRMAGHTVDDVRGHLHGNRWPFYRALAELPPDSHIVIENESDEIYYHASYFAHPRVVHRAAEVPARAVADRYDARLNGKTGEFTIRGPGGDTLNVAGGLVDPAPRSLSPAAPGTIAGVFGAGLSVFVLGWLFLIAAAPGRGGLLSLVERLSLSYPAGVLLLALTLCACALLPPGIGLLAAAPAWMIVATLAAFRLRTVRAHPLAVSAAGEMAADARGRLPRFLTSGRLRALLVFALAAVSAATMVEPVWKWDAIAMWSMKARILFQERSLLGQAFQDPPTSYAHPDYPLLIPFLETWGFLSMGRADDWAVKFLFVPFVFSLGGILFAFGRALAGASFGALLALVGIALPAAIVRWTAGSLPSAYADYPLSLFVAASAFCLYRWCTERRATYGFLAAFFAGGAAWAKNEGTLFVLLIALTAVVVAIRDRRREGWAVAALAVALLVPWRIFLATVPPAAADFELSDLTVSVLWSNRERVPFMLWTYLREFLNPVHWLLLWPGVVVALVVARRHLRAPEWILAAVLAAQIAGYFAIHWISRADPRWHLDTTLRRLVLHVAPLGVMVMGAAIARWWGQHESRIDVRE